MLLPAAIFGLGTVGNAVVVGSTGAVGTLAGGWRYDVASSIATVSPASGQYGMRVTIDSTALRGYGLSVVSASLVGLSAQIWQQSDTSVVVAAANGPLSQTQGAVVFTADTGATVSRSNSWTYIVPGTISEVSPTTGYGDTQVTILGMELCGGGSNVVNVTLAGFAADSVSATLCSGRVVVTARDLGANVTGDDVVLISNTGAIVSQVSGWTYVSSGSISSVVPNAGQVGDTVTINGTGLLSGGSSVLFVTLAGVRALVLEPPSDTMVVATVVTAGSGTGDVVITGSTGAVVRLVGGWSYSTVSSVAPNSGQRGTIVTISGYALFGRGSNIPSQPHVGAAGG